MSCPRRAVYGLCLATAVTACASEPSLDRKRPGSIAGLVLTADGAPAEGLPVTAGQWGENGHVLLPETSVTTEWNGRYTLGPLPPGTYTVSVEVDGRTFFPGVLDKARAGTVRVLEGVPASGIDIWLTPARRFIVSGRVFWPDGAVVEDVAIEYGDPEGTHSGVWFLSPPWDLFELTGVPPGTLVLLARGESDRGPLVGLASTEVAVGAVQDVAIALGAPGEVTGRVRFEDGVPAPSGPIAVALEQRLLDVSPLYPVSASVVDADSGFTLRDTLGRYTVRLDGLAPGLVVKRVLRAGVPIPGNELFVGVGERVSGVEIVIGR